MSSNRKSKQSQIDELQFRSSFYAQIVAHLFVKYDIEILKVSKEVFQLWSKSQVVLKHRVNQETGNFEVMASFEKLDAKEREIDG